MFNPYRGGKVSSVCHPCPAGTTSNGGARQCWPCGKTKKGLPKSSAVGSGVCAACTKGSFLTAPCVAGNRPSSACSKCPLGSYSTTRNALKCTTCPGGLSTAKLGSTSKAQCHPCGVRGVKCSCRNFIKDQVRAPAEINEPWNQVGSYRLLGSDQCIRCLSGTRARNPFALSADECIPCPAGTAYDYNTFPRRCRACPAGTKSFGRGASVCRSAKAAPCPKGKKKGKNGVCVAELSHNVCIDIGQNGRCDQCPKGYCIDAKGGGCKLCPEGTFSLGSQTTCDATCKFPLVNPPAKGIRHCYCAKDYFYDDYLNQCIRCEPGSTIEGEAHLTRWCNPDCEKFPFRFFCEPPKCKAPRFGRTTLRGECRRCPKGLVVRPGSVYCTKKEDGCMKGMVLGLGAHRYGEDVTCFDPTSP